MSREREYIELAEELRERNICNEKCIVAILGSIAHSLAIIVDQMKEDEQNESLLHRRDNGQV